MIDLDPEDVCGLIALARRFQVREQGGMEEDSSHPLDETAAPVLAEDEDDPVEEEIRALLASLGRARQNEMVALMWLGRGDAPVEEFDDLLRQASEDLPAEEVADYLLAQPMLAEDLTQGLACFGHQCDEG